MDRFEIEGDMTPDERERTYKAIMLVQKVIEMAAEQFDLCPVCLVYLIADLTADSEEKGLVQHAPGEETEH